jgi:ketosteroid isomerase-like protein
MRGLAVAGFLLFAVGASWAGEPQKATGDETARIRALENAWNEAEAHHDVKALSFLLGDPFSYTDDDGSFMDKAMWLARIGSGVDEYDSLGNTKVEIHVFGTAAVVVGEYHEKLKVAGKMVSRSGRFTDTWIQQNGQWKCVASQATLMSK